MTLPVAFTRLISEKKFLDGSNFREAGLNTRSFRALCRALHVPMLHLGNQRFVDAFTLSIALKIAMRLGKKDLLVQGCRTLKRNEGDEPHYRRELSEDEVEKDLAQAIKEIVGAAHSQNQNLDVESLRTSYFNAAKVFRSEVYNRLAQEQRDE